MKIEKLNPQRRPHVIVVGNEKGGTGKSTTAIHLLVGLGGDGFQVGYADLDEPLFRKPPATGRST